MLKHLLLHSQDQVLTLTLMLICKVYNYANTEEVCTAAVRKGVILCQPDKVFFVIERGKINIEYAPFRFFFG